MSEYLITLDAWSGPLVGGGLVARYLSTHGRASGPAEVPANTLYDARISDPGFIEASLFGAGRTYGAGSVTAGEVVLSNADGALDGWLDDGFDGRAIRIDRVADPRLGLAAAERLFTGTMEAVDATSDALTSLRLRLYDRRLDLDQPIQTARYGGTTAAAGASADGGPDLKGKVKPLVFGRVFKVPAVSVNPHNLIYQVHSGAVSSISVFDAGVPLTDDGDVASLAALAAAVIPGGRYRTCRALGLFRLGASPYRTVTADVIEGAGLADRSAARVVERMLARMGLAASVDAASVAALAAAAPSEVGIYIGDERSGLAAMQDVLASVGGWLLTAPTGAIQVGRLAAPGVPVLEIGEGQIEARSLRLLRVSDPGEGLPAWRVVLRHRRQWHQYQAGDVAEMLSADVRADLARDALDVIAEAPAVRSRHPLAPELTFDALLTDGTAAAAEAARRLALYSVRRDLVAVDVPAELAGAARLGLTVRLVLSRLGYQAGRDMVVIGRREQWRDGLVTLTLWG
jgi:hypothetical protein